MEVLFDKNSATLASLKIVLSQEDYQPKVEKAIKEYSKKAQLKGFRPGKVPAAVISRMYGKSIKVDEINNLLSSTVSDYIKDNKLRLVGDPVPRKQETETIDWDTQTTFEFEFDLGMPSDFTVDLAALPATTEYSVKASGAKVEEAIERLRERFADTIHPETSEEGDMLYGELKQEATEFSTQTAIPTKRVKPEHAALFVGAKIGDTITFDIQQTFEDEQAVAHITAKKKEDVAELSGDFTLVVSDITRMQPAAFDQAFFDKALGAGEVDSEEAFRTKVAEIMQDNYAREAKSLLRRDIEKTLLSAIPIELPTDFLKDWLERINDGKFTREQIEEQFEDFEKTMKLNLIKGQVAEQANVEVQYAEVFDYARQMIRSQFGMYGGDPSMDEIVDRVAQNFLADKEKDNMSNTYNQVFSEKVMDVMEATVPKETKEIGVEELEELLKNA
jgi:trigger factor